MTLLDFISSKWRRSYTSRAACTVRLLFRTHRARRPRTPGKVSEFFSSQPPCRPPPPPPPQKLSFFFFPPPPSPPPPPPFFFFCSPSGTTGSGCDLFLSVYPCK